MGSLDTLRSQIQNAAPVLQRLDQEMERLQFDPLVPSSVNAAKHTVDALIDHLMGGFRTNPILGPLTDNLKSQYLDGIEARVADARARV